MKIIVKIDPEVAELVPGFLKNREDDIRRLQDSLEKGDYETLERIGHSLKGTGAGFGFDAITEMGSRIEKAAQDKNIGVIKKGIEELSNYMKHLEVSYE